MFPALLPLVAWCLVALPPAAPAQEPNATVALEISTHPNPALVANTGSQSHQIIHSPNKILVDSKPPAIAAPAGRGKRADHQSTMTNSDDKRSGFDRRSFLRLASTMGIASVGVVPGELMAVEPQNSQPGPSTPPNPSAALPPKGTLRLPTIPPTKYPRSSGRSLANFARASRSTSKAL